MLGNAKQSGGNVTYLGIYDGKVVKTWSKKPDNVPNLKERVNKNDKTVYYITFDFVSGYLTGASIRTGEYGDSIMLTLSDGAETYQLEFGANSKYATTFMQRMMNIALDKELRIMPYSFMDENGKQRTGLSLSQDNEKLGYAYERDAVPELVAKTRGGKTTYDDTDRYNFFMEEFRKFEAKVNKAAPLPDDGFPSVPAPEEEEDFDDDLPF